MRRALARLGLALCALVALAPCVARAQPSTVCQVAQRAVVPVDLVDGHLLVSLLVNGSPVTVILDTGADRTMLNEATVQRLGVKLDDWVSSTVVGVGGYVRHRNADPQTLALGDLQLRRHTVAADNTVTVGEIPLTQLAGRTIGGLLGQDFLANFDLAIDLPAHQVILYDVHDCKGHFLPWDVPYVTLPATQPFGKRLVFPVMVDGHPLQAVLDTGSNVTLLIATGLMRLGLTAAMLEADPVATVVGVGAGRLAIHRHRFAALRIGNEVMRNVSLWTVPLHVIPPVDMLVGADWLQSHRVWLSYATTQVFIAQRAGG